MVKTQLNSEILNIIIMTSQELWIFKSYLEL
jgi:hypothetical protein